MPHSMHVDKETLDRYCLGQVSNEMELADLEEHLLVCGSCQGHLEAATDFLQALREAERSLGCGTPRFPVHGGKRKHTHSENWLGYFPA